MPDEKIIMEYVAKVDSSFQKLLDQAKGINAETQQIVERIKLLAKEGGTSFAAAATAMRNAMKELRDEQSKQLKSMREAATPAQKVKIDEGIKKLNDEYNKYSQLITKAQSCLAPAILATFAPDTQTQ